MAIEWGLKQYPRKREQSKEAAELMYGSILADNSNWLFDLNDEDRSYIEKMKAELRKSPNNPFTLSISKHQLLKAIAILELNKGGIINV